MRYGYSKNNPAFLINKGCAKVFDKELDAMHALQPGDELVTDTVTPLFESLASDYGDFFKILKAENVPSGLTFEEDNVITAMAEDGASKDEIAKSLHLSMAAVNAASVFNEAVIAKANIAQSASAGSSFDSLFAKAAGIAESRRAEEELDQRAFEIRNENPYLTHEQAMAKAYEALPHLVQKIL